MRDDTKAKVYVESLIIPTYSEPEAEELPMFAENRVHQRTSGDPYPNRVVTSVNRAEPTDREYVAVRLENEYISVVILPEIGGRIYSATDKTTGQEIFYKQHVIKPALIGVLGSWVSGGVEFNWPFHHRASGYMECDFVTEELADGSVVCRLSEHDPIDGMRGTVSIIVRPDTKYFETRMRLYNRTELPHSFLWWENAAVAVNEDYQIFFPQDVTYVNFHYLKSRTTFPVAGNGVFNGIPMREPRDISWHKNTREATSYFACASDYDFFGGYDHGKGCGVVHIGDHHISPGKKMFTWAYGQLSRSWEKALTDTDGQYAELMAGSYSDNQPDFSWLAPYETKEFSQFWYPISAIGTPTYADLSCALRIEREGDGARLAVQSTGLFENARLRVADGDRVYLDETLTLDPKAAALIELGSIPDLVTVTLFDEKGRVISEYAEKRHDLHNMPEPITDMPSAAGMSSARELYLAGVHVEQYRDPAVRPDAYWKEALKREPEHIPTLIAMARYYYRELYLDEAETYARRALGSLTEYNTRPQSGECYYVLGQILEARGRYKEAYDSYYKAAIAADSVSAAMTRIALLDIRNADFAEAERHAEWALDYGRKNSLAVAALILAKRESGDGDTARELAHAQLEADPLDHLIRFITDAPELYSAMRSDPVRTCMDMASDLEAMGRYDDARRLLEGLVAHRPDMGVKTVYYSLAYFARLCGEDGLEYQRKAELAPIGRSFPSRHMEARVLEDAISHGGGEDARLLLGCLLYHKRHYAEAAEHFLASGGSYIAKRCLAVAYFSHLGHKDEALTIMRSLTEERPEDATLLYETVVLMNKLGRSAEEKIALIESHGVLRDDIAVELAKAYNQSGRYDEALDTLLSRRFVPCEGGEHAIADQYMFAYLCKGIQAMRVGDHTTALEYFRDGQTLPDSLGAGVWNHCKRIPLRYREALCLETLGKDDEAREIYRYIAETEVEYFSNMHLPELPYYKAQAYSCLGETLKSRAIVTEYRRKWGSVISVKDNGFFATTPFFMPFIDAPEDLRRSRYLYLTGLIERCLGNGMDADERMRESFALNNDNLFALIM